MPHPNSKVSAIVLAAGRSVRMGRNKLLLHINGKPMLHWVLDAILDGGLEQVILVVGFQGERVRKSCECYADKIKYVNNPHFAEGRATSIRAGLGGLPASSVGALIAPADVPFITGDLIRALLDRFRATGRITFPVVGGEKGHPVIFPAQSFPLLNRLSGDETLHDYLLQHPEETAPLEWHHAGCVMDIDTEVDMDSRNL